MEENLIKSFFERPDIKTLLQNAEQGRSKVLTKVKIYWVIFLLISLIVFVTLPDIFGDPMNLITFIAFISVMAYTIYYSLAQKYDPRNTVMSQFALLINPSLVYTYTPQTTPGWLDDERLIGSYERWDSTKNYITFTKEKNNEANKYTVSLEGIEITTSSGSGKHRHVVCHSFITQIKFPEGSLNLATDLWVRAERGSFIPGFEDSKTFGITKNKVFLESNEFEKMFDVYCADQVKAREILNPHTMDALIHFIQSFNGERSYDFLFTKDSIFVKYNLLRSTDSSIFNRPTIFSDFSKNIKLFSDFYAELLRFEALVDEFDPFYKT